MRKPPGAVPVQAIEAARAEAGAINVVITGKVIEVRAIFRNKSRREVLISIRSVSKCCLLKSPIASFTRFSGNFVFSAISMISFMSSHKS